MLKAPRIPSNWCKKRKIEDVKVTFRNKQNTQITSYLNKSKSKCQATDYVKMIINPGSKAINTPLCVYH